MRVAEVGAVAVEEAEERLPTPVQPKCEPLEHLKHSAVICCLSFTHRSERLQVEAVVAVEQALPRWTASVAVEVVRWHSAAEAKSYRLISVRVGNKYHAGTRNRMRTKSNQHRY